MELSAELFAEIIAATEPAAAPKGLTEKRRADRIPLRFEAQLSSGGPGGSTNSVKTIIRDFSPRGFCLEHSTPMEVGAQFVLALPGRGGTLSLLCSVAHSKPAKGQNFYVGGEFVCTLQTSNAAKQAAELERIRNSILF